MAARKTPVHLRPYGSSDLFFVHDIEKHSFEEPLSSQEFQKYAADQRFVMSVAELDQLVVGFSICELHDWHIKLCDLAVYPACRRHMIGTALIDRMTQCLSKSRRTCITCQIHEINLPMLCFLRKFGFRSCGVLRNHYSGVYDAILMQFRLPGTDEETDALNRYQARC